MAAQPLTAPGASAEVKHSVAGNNAGARETESSFSATLSEQRAHHQSSSTSARSQTPDAGSDRPSNAGGQQDTKQAHEQEKSKSDNKNQNVADRPATDRDNAQDHAATDDNQLAPGEIPHHGPLPANSAKASNPDLDNRGDQLTRKTPHPGTDREYQPRHETAEHHTILKKVDTRPGSQTTAEQHSVTHDQVNRMMSGRERHSRPQTSADITTVKGHADSSGHLRTNTLSQPIPLSETISNARAFHGHIIQRLTTARIDVTPAAGQGAKAIDGPANTATLIQGAPLHMMPAGKSPSAPTSISPATTSGTALTGGIKAPFASDQWQQALTKQSLRLSHSGGGHARLTLHPPSLGTLHVSLQLGSQAQIHFASPHAEVRAAVNSALPQLKDAFADAGIDLGQTSVWDNPQQFDTHDGDRRDQKNIDRATDSVEDSSETDTAAMQLTRITGRTPSGGVDIFA